MEEDEKAFCPWCGGELDTSMWRFESLVAASAYCTRCGIRGPMAAINIDVEFAGGEEIDKERDAMKKVALKVFDMAIRGC